MITLIHGDCTDVLPTLPVASVQCVISSPPYFGLRDYHIPPTRWPAISYAPLAGVPPVAVPPSECCLGLEDDPLSYIGHLVHVFRLVRAVLRPDGVLWLNLGDSYAQPSKWGARSGNKNHTSEAGRYPRRPRASAGLKDKDLYGVPWRAALALQADGWYLRCDCIWEKPSCMPERVDDRPTRSHEYLFLLALGERYYYDAAAIGEPSAQADRPQRRRAEELADQAGLTDAHMAAIRSAGITDTDKARATQHGGNTAEVLKLAAEAKTALSGYYREFIGSGTRNRRSVWRIPSAPYAGAHFATFPEALVEPCVLASTRPGDTILDPFSGTATVGKVAERYGRDFLGIEANGAYLALAETRTNGVQIDMEALL